MMDMMMRQFPDKVYVELKLLAVVGVYRFRI